MHSRSNRLGSWLSGDVANFAVAAPNATHIDLCLFDDHGVEHRHPMTRLGDIWRCTVPNVAAGQQYGLRADGPWDPQGGHFYNTNKLLVDPYALMVTDTEGEHRLRAAIDLDDADRPDPVDTAPFAPRSILVDHQFPAVSGIEYRGVERSDLVIYEAHVRGLTQRHPLVPEALRGTFAGAAYPPILEHLRQLGVTAIEFLPITSCLSEPFLLQHGLSNYWGYNSLNWFAPNLRYSAAARAGDPLGTFTELRAMVEQFHHAGIAVILDVVYNHTCEGPVTGPVVSLRGLDNCTYYRVDPRDGLHYRDTTGCGNTLRTDGPWGLRLVLDSLRWWAESIGIDGFRFDLAVSLARDPVDFSAHASFLQAIAADPVLRDRLLIAEPWDVGRPDSIQTGAFPPGWHDWNNGYRDVIRDFWRGTPGQHATLATRLTGSRDLFGWRHQGPAASVNFVTAHDGFTLRDLVTYNDKHNLANAQGGADGSDDNRSWNCGVEGPTDDPEIIAIRQQQMRSIIGTLLLSWGIPMITMGDEFGRTQQGNNNAYCQDNGISWLDWSASAQDASGGTDMLRWVRECLAVRRQLPWLTPQAYEQYAVAWFRPDGQAMTDQDWAETNAHSLAYRIMRGPCGGDDDAGVIVLLNAWSQTVTYAPPAGEHWKAWSLLLCSAPVPPGLGHTLDLPPRCLVLVHRR